MVETTMQRSKTATKRRPSHNEGVIPQLARAVREVEASAQRGKATPMNRTKFHVIALLMREERNKAKNDPELSDQDRAETLKRLLCEEYDVDDATAENDAKALLDSWIEAEIVE